MTPRSEAFLGIAFELSRWEGEGGRTRFKPPGGKKRTQSPATAIDASCVETDCAHEPEVAVRGPLAKPGAGTGVA